MNDCTNVEVRDQLPDLVNGTLSAADEASVRTHLSACADCTAELRLLEAVYRTRPATPAVDGARIAAALPRAAEQTRHRTPWLRIAAAVLVVSFGGLAVWSGIERPPEAVVASSRSVPVTDIVPDRVMPEVSALPNSVAIVDSAPTKSPAAGLDLVTGISDFSDAELSALTAELEGMETRPVAEPEGITLNTLPGAEEDE